MTAEETKDEVDRFLVALTEKIPDAHIQVLATWNHSGKTCSINTGIGNWYARQGLAHEFINADIAQEHAMQLASKINPPEDPIST